MKPGYVIITEPDKPTIESDTFTCVHCNMIVHVHIGSGKLRGFCSMCGGPHCGEVRFPKNCWECVPFEAKIESMEGNRSRWGKIDLSSGTILNYNPPTRTSGLIV